MEYLRYPWEHSGQKGLGSSSGAGAVSTQVVGKTVSAPEHRLRTDKHPGKFQSVRGRLSLHTRAEEHAQRIRRRTPGE